MPHRGGSSGPVLRPEALACGARPATTRSFAMTATTTSTPPIALRPSFSLSALRIGWGAALFFGAIGAYSAWSIFRYPQDWSRDWPILAFFGYVIPGCGGFIVLAALWATLRWLKQGRTRLIVPSGQISLGQPLHAVVECGRTIEPTGPAKAELKCIASNTAEVRKRGGKTVAIVWKSQCEAPAARTIHTARGPAPGPGSRFDVRLDLPPAGAVESGAAAERITGGGRVDYRWSLEFSAPTRGVDYEAHFDLPVGRNPA
jgi:hypothetical protein